MNDIEKRVINKAEGKCQTCNSELGLVVHCRTMEPIRKETNNLIALCSRCHRLFHGLKDTSNYKRQSIIALPEFDDFGNVILTKENIKKLRTDKGGFTNATLKPLMRMFDFVQTEKGWVKQLEGHKLSEHDYLEAFRGRDIFA